MKSGKRIGRAPLGSVLAGRVIGVTFAVLFLLPHAYADDGKISRESIDALSRMNRALSEVAATVKPSVVNISSVRTVKVTDRTTPFFNDPFFKRFFGDDFWGAERPRERRRAGLGSGVIVDRRGYVLTNHHVVRGADEITVTLSDKREFKGNVIGTDQKTDLAVVKIDADHLPVVRFGDSDTLKTGEIVLAIGNPFGLTQTVTTGIVSATGRANVGIADYEDFIQTDAAINPGNSGGALVNIRGELVGINTAIFSTTGGYQGIGFAIPSNMAKAVMESLIAEGKVVRGWLGVSIQPLTTDLARQFGLRDDAGALVSDVVEESPAEKSGIRRGDVITEFDRERVKDVRHLRNLVASARPGREVAVKLVREGKEMTVRVTIAEMPSDIGVASQQDQTPLRGVVVQTLTPQVRDSLNIPKRINGVVVTDVQEGSPADGILARNDVIMEIDKKKVSSVGSYEQVVSALPPDQNILVLVFRKGTTVYVTIPGK